jgi:hypothetical protein
VEKKTFQCVSLRRVCVLSFVLIQTEKPSIRSIYAYRMLSSNRTRSRFDAAYKYFFRVEKATQPSGFFSRRLLDFWLLQCFCCSFSARFCKCEGRKNENRKSVSSLPCVQVSARIFKYAHGFRLSAGELPKREHSQRVRLSFEF